MNTGKYFTLSVITLLSLLWGCTEPVQQPTGPTVNKPEAESLAGTTTVASMPRSHKRGVSFGIKNVTDAFILSDFICWHYNWGNTPSGPDNVQLFLEQNNIDYCPMCWNGNYSKDRIRAFVQGHPNTGYLLGFNEPNLTDQANMTPQKAAELWPDVVALAKELNLKLGAPAMNYGTLAGYSDPVKWLDEFFRQPGISINDIDFIPIHCYMTSCSAVKGFVEKFRKYDKPIWMTEFCAWDISGVDVQKSYMSDVINYFEQEELVERYAWFIPRSNNSLNSKPYNQLLTKQDPIELTPLGEIYAGMSSLDKSVCLDATNPIPAHWYTDFNIFPAVTNSTDAEGGKLMLYNLAMDRWVEYQIDATSPKNNISLRYATLIDTQLAIYVDGDPVKMVSLPKTGSMNTWTTFTVDDFPVSGKHYIRFHVINGAINLSYFKLN